MGAWRSGDRRRGIALCGVVLVAVGGCQAHHVAAIDPNPSGVVIPATPMPLVSSLPSCATHQLRLSFDVLQGAGGDNVAVFRLTNTGIGSCQIQGFPGVTLNRPGAMGDVAARSSADYVSYIPIPFTPRLVVVKPGAFAEFGVEGSDSNAGTDQLWPSSASATVYPPGSTVALSVKVVMPIPAGEHSVRVTPIEPAGCLPYPNCK